VNGNGENVAFTLVHEKALDKILQGQRHCIQDIGKELRTSLRELYVAIIIVQVILSWTILRATGQFITPEEVQLVTTLALYCFYGLGIWLVCRLIQFLSQIELNHNQTVAIVSVSVSVCGVPVLTCFLAWLWKN